MVFILYDLKIEITSVFWFWSSTIYLFFCVWNVVSTIYQRWFVRQKRSISPFTSRSESRQLLNWTSELSSSYCSIRKRVHPSIRGELNMLWPPAWGNTNIAFRKHFPVITLTLACTVLRTAYFTSEMVRYAVLASSPTASKATRRLDTYIPAIFPNCDSFISIIICVLF